MNLDHMLSNLPLRFDELAKGLGALSENVRSGFATSANH